jgi:hypothetical protein
MLVMVNTKKGNMTDKEKLLADGAATWRPCDHLAAMCCQALTKIAQLNIELSILDLPWMMLTSI